MGVSIVPRQRGKLDILMSILSRGGQGFMAGKREKAQGERQVEQDKLKAALTQAQTGQAQRANIPQPTSGADQINRLKLGWLQSLPPEEQAAALERMVTKPSSVTNVNLGQSTKSKIESNILDSDKAVLGLKIMDTSFKDKFTEYSFQTRAAGTRIAEKLGFEPPEEGIVRVGKKELEEYSAWQRQAEEAFLTFRKWATGVAGGEKEMSDIRKVFATKDKSATEFKAMLKQAINYQAVYKQSLQLYLQQGSVLPEAQKLATRNALNSVSAQGGSPIAPTGKTKDPSQMTTEEIEAELKGLK